MLVITERRLYAYRRRWLRETERSRLNGVERPMASDNRLLPPFRRVTSIYSRRTSKP